MHERELSYPLTGRQAWLLLFGVVTIHELTCKPGKLLSEEVDRQLDRNRWVTVLFGLVTVAHLYNLLPKNIDPYHWLARLTSR